MKKSLLIGCVIISVSLMGLTGCAQKVEDSDLGSNAGAPNSPVSQSASESGDETLNESGTDSSNLASGTSPKMSEEAAKAMQEAKAIGDIKSITLRDIEGNVVDRTFTAEEIQEIKKAYNESFIMDTAHIEMITGMSMTIELEDGKTVFISSYGEEKYIVATMDDGSSYHLGCEFIGKMLLEGNVQ
ncbi:hypothetical protein [Fusibacter ferrireducens]|uniref:Uncharacterized protein n=1 Tax=Fusibacter ferrireducens TaxID=2785058 RepID=A0ABR9ZZQ6_9FIRM|nr:hypothetical protein [Fusibacter ferrireducens]MBF4695939.1 hypothetical protein [Fusibacter ferrireducens]